MEHLDILRKEAKAMGVDHGTAVMPEDLNKRLFRIICNHHINDEEAIDIARDAFFSGVSEATEAKRHIEAAALTITGSVPRI